MSTGLRVGGIAARIPKHARRHSADVTGMHPKLVELVDVAAYLGYAVKDRGSRKELVIYRGNYSLSIPRSRQANEDTLESLSKQIIRHADPERLEKIETLRMLAGAVVDAEGHPPVDIIALDNVISASASTTPFSLSLDLPEVPVPTTPEVRSPIQQMGDVTHPHIISEKPFLARGKRISLAQQAVYDSKAVIQRTWSDGHVDFACSVCDYTAETHKSVANHYGRSGPPHAHFLPTPATGVTPIEPADEYTPSDRLLNALLEALKLAGTTDLEGLAAAALKWAHDRPDLDHLERGTRPLTDSEIVNKIRALVDTGTLAKYEEEIEALRASLTEQQATQLTLEVERDALVNEVRRLKEERATIAELLMSPTDE